MLEFLFKKKKKDLEVHEDSQWETAELTARLMRELLGSIDVEKFRFERKLSANDLAAYHQTVAAFFPTIIEPTVKRFIAAQERIMSRGSAELRQFGYVDPRDQVIFGRGTMNGLLILMEEFQQAFYSHIAAVEEKQEKFDPYALFPELFDLRKVDRTS